MNKEDLWLLLKKTGKIEYYLKYKNYGKEGKQYAQKNRGYYCQ